MLPLCTSSVKCPPTAKKVNISLNCCVYVCVCSVCPILLLCLCTPVMAGVGETVLLEGWSDVWVFRFFLNLLGYSTIIIPGYLLIRYFKRINYLETGVLSNVPFCFQYSLGVGENKNIL